MFFRTILHPTDFSEASAAALVYASELAHRQGGRLLIFHAVETLGPENVTYGEAVSRLQPEGYRHRLWEDLLRVRPPHPDVLVEYVLNQGDPAQAILRAVEEHGGDLIVMGSHGRRGLRRLLMGSVAEQVVRAARCPVLVVKDLPAPTAPDVPDMAGSWVGGN
jgi:nucleotide-binding universal stress UspA family protein